MATNLSPSEREEIETLTETYNVESAAAIVGRLGLSPEKAPAIKQLLGEEPADSEPAHEDPEDTGGDADAEVTDEMVRDHYEHLDDLYAELGTIGDDTLAAGVTGRKGWYKDRPSSGGDWDGVGRQTTLARDYDVLLDHLSWADIRSIHATVQYSKAERYAESWKPYQFGDDGREWADDGESPTLDYADIAAYAPFADIDLEDEYKQQRPDGDLDTELVEAAIEKYIEAFAELAGGREHVYALDSVGGAYVMAAPTTTRPIAEHFADDREARERVFSELRGRIDAWLGNVREVVNDAIPGVQDVFEPDLLNQKNRNYKAPLTVHKDLDGVVTPLDTENPAYEYTPITDADGEMIDEATEWAADFTGEHDSAVASIVSTLWPDEYDAAASWDDALDAWVEAEREAEREAIRAKERRQERRRNRDDLREHGGDRDKNPTLGTAGSETTPYIDDVLDAVETVDIKPLVKDVVKAEGGDWEPTGRSDHFNPESDLWKDSDSGETCFVDESSNTFGDVGDTSGGGYAVDFMAIKAGALTDPSDCPAKGADFWAGVEALREEGYDIPVWTPDAPEVDGDQMPYWSLRKFALTHGIVDEDDLKTTEGDDGETYLGFKSRDYRRAVLWAEEAGLDTGRVDHLD